jgi:hypothetical protein
MYVKNEGIPIQRQGDRTKRVDLDIEPKYTRGGHQILGTQGDTKIKGVDQWMYWTIQYLVPVCDEW